jgi:hypothetical protein
MARAFLEAGLQACASCGKNSAQTAQDQPSCKQDKNPWCIVFGVLTLAVVLFLVIHPLNCLSSESTSVGLLAAFILGY